MSLTQISVTRHVVPAVRSWHSFTLSFTLPETVSVPDPVHLLALLLVPLLDPLLPFLVLALLVLAVGDLGKRVGAELALRVLAGPEDDAVEIPVFDTFSLNSLSLV